MNRRSFVFAFAVLLLVPTHRAAAREIAIERAAAKRMAFLLALAGLLTTDQVFQEVMRISYSNPKDADLLRGLQAGADSPMPHRKVRQ